MASTYVGYPAGSPNAPQSMAPGGALMAPQGPAAGPNPNMFQTFLDQISTAAMGLGNSPLASRAARYGPGVAQTVGIGMQQGLGAGIGAGTATLAGGAAVQALTKGIADPRLRLAAQVAGGLVNAAVATPLGGQLGKAVQGGIGQMFGGTQAAVGDAVNAYATTQREQGKSGLSGKEAGLGGMSSDEYDRQRQIMYDVGLNMPHQYLMDNYQILQKYKDGDVARQMQLNQQNAQLAGALNRQMATYQLAGQSMGQANALTSQILASNPYQASVLNTGAVRGI